MTSIEKLNQVFTKDFIQANKDIGNIDDLYDQVVKVDNSISREEYDKYISELSEAMHHDELSESDLENVAGGFAWPVVGGVCALISLCYKGGEAIGKGIYYLTHRK